MNGRGLVVLIAFGIFSKGFPGRNGFYIQVDLCCMARTVVCGIGGCITSPSIYKVLNHYGSIAN
jgi:hypothetical protein